MCYDCHHHSKLRAASGASVLFLWCPTFIIRFLSMHISSAARSESSRSDGMLCRVLVPFCLMQIMSEQAILGGDYTLMKVIPPPPPPPPPPDSSASICGIYEIPLLFPITRPCPQFSTLTMRRSFLPGRTLDERSLCCARSGTPTLCPFWGWQSLPQSEPAALQPHSKYKANTSIYLPTIAADQLRWCCRRFCMVLEYMGGGTLYNAIRTQPQSIQFFKYALQVTALASIRIYRLKHHS